MSSTSICSICALRRAEEQTKAARPSRWARCRLVRVGITALACSMLATAANAQLFGRSAERDIAQGAELAKLVEKQIGIYSQPSTDAYLRELGDRLAARGVNDPRWKFSFQIVDQAEPNAFSIPGGGVYVSRGLLALINREDELAGVLGHEMAHVTQRHSAREQRRGILPGLLSLPGNAVGAVVSENLGALLNAPIETAGEAWLSHYSRGQEKEADRIGIRTAALAGYDPTALADILDHLRQDVARQTGQDRGFSIFDSHPMTETRREDIQRSAATLRPAATPHLARDVAALFSKLDGLWWEENPESGVFRKDQFLQPAIGFTITFPEGWSHQNTPQRVIAVHPKQEAMLLLGISGPAVDPQATGTRFIEKMRARAGIDPVSTRNASLGEFPAFVATYLDRSGRAAVYLHFAWVTMAGTTFQLIGLAPEKHRETLRNAALTLRPLTSLERGSVTGKRLRIAAAHEGERLENLAARTGNVWSPAYTALVNGLNIDSVLKEGQLVKIARVEPATAEAAPSGK